MRSKFHDLSALIFILSFIGLLVCVPVSFSEEEIVEVPPQELIREMLEDENLPDEIKEELKSMLESGEIGVGEDVPYEELDPDPAPERRIEDVPREEIERSPRPRSSSGSKVSPPKQAKAAPEEAPGKISLDLKGVDIIDVLKMLSARSNLNIVAGRNVRGRVTLFLKDVDVWDAFEIILAANSLAYEKENDIINVMTERDYEQLYGDKFYTKEELRIFKLEYAKAIDVSKALNQAKSKIGKVIIDEISNAIIVMDSPKVINDIEEMISKLDMPVEKKVFALNYAKAEDIKTKVSEFLTKGLGVIQVDERTNKVVVTELSSKMPEIGRIIEELDEKHQEVLIEAKIIQVELTDEYRYGVNWRAVFNKHPGSDGLAFNFDNITGSVFDGAATGGAFTIAQMAHGYFENAIEVLQTVGKTNVISCPRLTVLNNEEAKVLVGTNQPYVETNTTLSNGETNNAEQVKWVDVGVELTVTPTINREGFVTMKIKPKISSLGTPLDTATNNKIPVVSTSETETTVMVKDGTTILIAGLIEDRDVHREDKIPFLGDIPILGNFFKRETSGNDTLPEKQELVIFLTPYIINGTETFPESENTWFGDAIKQRKLLKNEVSLAVEDNAYKKDISREIEPPKPEVDKTSKINEDIEWFKDLEKISESMKEKMELKKEEAKEKVAEAEETGDTEPLTMVPTNLIPPTIGGYYNYYEALRNRIYWVAKDSSPRDLQGKREDVKIAFTVGDDGHLKGEPEVLNKVDEDLAEAAVMAVVKSAPFPPFPQMMEKTSQMFKVIITYQ